MKLPISLYIALRYWKTKSSDRFGKLITRLASIGIALGVMALIIVLSVMNGLEHMQKVQRLAGLPHMLVESKTPFLLKDTATIEKQILTLAPQVQKVVPINQDNVILQTPENITAAQIIGIRQFSDAPQLIEFSRENLNNLLPPKQFKLLISASLADRTHLQVGDKVRVMLTDYSQYTPFGQIPVERLFTVSGIYYAPDVSEQGQVFTNLSDIGRLMRILPTQVKGFRLYLRDPFAVQDVRNELSQVKTWQLHDWREQRGEFFQAVKMEKNMMGLLVSLIIIVAISNILTSLSLMVVDKKNEIAILQTQGLTRRKIRQIFIWQGLLVGINGTFWGTLIGTLIAANFQKIWQMIMPDGLYLPTRVEPLQIVIIVICALLFTLLSTLYPAYRAAKVQPARALRDE